jgi:hypothetical protein
MFKKLIFSLVILATAASTAVMGTQALVSDSVALGASTYSTGTVDLTISKTGEEGSYVDSVAGFTDVTINPGDSIIHPIWLKNESAIGSLKIYGQATVETVEGEVVNIDPGKVSIKFVKHGSDPVEETSNSSLTTWANSKKAFGTGSTFNLPAGSAQQYDMIVTLSSTAPEGTFSFSFVFTGDYVAATP